MANLSPIELARFWSKVSVGATAECWHWRGRVSDYGYGRFGPNGRAHRIAYEIINGPILEGLMVRHLCGHKTCVNPRHLEVGTAYDNGQDAIRLGEVRRGSANARAKINEDDALKIIANEDRLTGREMAIRYGVSVATISMIRNGKRWTHVQNSSVTKDAA